MALALTVRSLVVVLIPILGVALLRLANDQTLMRSRHKGPARNLALGLMLLMSLYLTGRAGIELWQSMGER